MLLVLLNWLLDGFLLSIIYLSGAAIFYKNILCWQDWLIFGYATTTAFIFIGTSKIGFYCLKMYLGCRAPIDSERQKIEPLLCEVLDRVNQIYRTNYQLDRVCLKIIDINGLTSQAIGLNTIVLSSGLLRATADEELRAIIALEIGHLYNRDSIILSAFIFSSLTIRVIIWLYVACIICFKSISAKIGKSNSCSLIASLAIVPLLLFLPIVMLGYMAQKLLNLGLYFMHRRYVYKADSFVKKLGYNNELISYLETTQAITEVDTSMPGRICAIYPSAMQRINYLEKSSR